MQFGPLGVKKTKQLIDSWMQQAPPASPSAPVLRMTAQNNEKAHIRICRSRIGNRT